MNNIDSIFIRIPKNASISVLSYIQNELDRTEYLGPDSINNLKYKSTSKTLILQGFTPRSGEYIKKILNDTWSQCYKFAIVRNPWARAVSSWKFGTWGTHPSQSWGSLTFEEFCEKLYKFDLDTLKILQGYRKDLVYHTGYQHSHITNKENKIIVDKICKLETLQQDFEDVVKMLSIPSKILPQRNTTNHKHYTEYYNSTTKDIISDIYQVDIKMFKYKYGQ